LAASVIFSREALKMPVKPAGKNVAGNPEQLRLDEVHAGGVPWKKRGPDLSKRQWGTVRKDYSDTGNAWDYFTHDQARSLAYRWGEDGIAGISDDKQRFCFTTTLPGLHTDGFDANTIITDSLGGACSDAIDTTGEGSGSRSRLPANSCPAARDPGTGGRGLG
jgi:hypothetical protein